MKTKHELPFVGPDKPWLAPLAGYSDLPFRLLCRRGGCAAACTEMISAKGLVYNSPGTFDLLKTCPADTPLIVQLFGAESEFLGKAAQIVCDRGDFYLDLNCGCSVRKVTKTGSGAALLREPDRLVGLAGEMVRVAGENRVGVKLRLGWQAGGENYLEVGKQLEDAGVAWITLHPRLAKQGFSGEASYECLALLADALQIPVIGSGDMWSAGGAKKCIEQTGISGVMFARGALRDPYVFARLKALYDCESEQVIPSTAQILRNLVELYFEHGDEYKALLRMRSLVPRMVKGMERARNFRKDLTLCKDWDSFNLIINQIESAENEKC